MTNQPALYKTDKTLTKTHISLWQTSNNVLMNNEVSDYYKCHQVLQGMSTLYDTILVNPEMNLLWMI